MAASPPHSAKTASSPHAKALRRSKRRRRSTTKEIEKNVNHARKSRSKKVSVDGSRNKNGKRGKSNNGWKVQQQANRTANAATGTCSYTYEEFIKLWTRAEKNIGVTTEELEDMQLVRAANNNVNSIDTTEQTKAQYGRLLPEATQVLIADILKLTPQDIFLDIGHGIGNACLQAAYTVGCEARGIEVVGDRHEIAEEFRNELRRLWQKNRKEIRKPVGQVDLRHGELQAVENHDFLRAASAAFANNFNEVFGRRTSTTEQVYYPDDYVAGLFASMKPGARLVTLHPLSMGPSRSQINEQRARHDLPPSPLASFFELEELYLGEARNCVKFVTFTGSDRPIKVYKYTRVSQREQQRHSRDGETVEANATNWEEAVMLCSNLHCEQAKSGEVIRATRKLENGRVVLNGCSCGVTMKNLRRKRKLSARAQQAAKDEQKGDEGD